MLNNEVRAARVPGSIILSTGKESPIAIRVPASALASLPTGRLKLSATPGDMEVKEVTAETSVPVRG
jgi:hypothetical protein